MVVQIAHIQVSTVVETTDNQSGRDDHKRVDASDPTTVGESELHGRSSNEDEAYEIADDDSSVRLLACSNLESNQYFYTMRSSTAELALIHAKGSRVSARWCIRR